MKHSPLHNILEYALEHAQQEPLPRRVSLYRDAATIMPNEEQARSLLALADEIESIEHKHQQLLLNFKRVGGAA